jgi:hypothetical protein
LVVVQGWSDASPFLFYSGCQFICIYEYHFQDKDKEGDLPLQQVSVDDILDAQRREQEAKQDQEKLLVKALKERGLHYIPDLSHDDMF